MSIYAKINSENIIENVIICEDSEISTLQGEWIKSTDFTGNPEVFGTYSREFNKFIKIKPHFDSWVLNENLEWVSPVEKPEGQFWWDEENTQWVEIIIPEGEDRLKTPEELAAIREAYNN